MTGTAQRGIASASFSPDGAHFDVNVDRMIYVLYVPFQSALAKTTHPTHSVSKLTKAVMKSQINLI